MPSEVSQRVGPFDVFAGWSSRIASRAAFFTFLMVELRDAVGLESHESSSRNSNAGENNRNSRGDTLIRCDDAS